MDPDDLYGLALDRFVRERDLLAKSLRKDRRRDEAAAVAARRKPSVAAWAVNQLVRTQRPAVQELFRAGDELREAQSELLAGCGDGRALRAAGDRERLAVEDLVERARGLLSSAGNEMSETVIGRVGDTLHAAALDERAREQVRHGRLERELRHAGLGFELGVEDADVAPAPAAASPARPRESGGAAGGSSKRSSASTPSVADKRAERERAAAERADAERIRHERLAARRDARAARETARRRAQTAANALRGAEERREEAAQALHDADEALAAAAANARETAAALTRAEAELAEAERPG